MNGERVLGVGLASFGKRRRLPNWVEQKKTPQNHPQLQVRLHVNPGTLHVFGIESKIWISLGAALTLCGCSFQPAPYDPAFFQSHAEENYRALLKAEEKISAPIDLYEAMARALKFNLDHQVKIAETRLRSAQLNVSHYSMLPNLVVNSGYTSRNNVQASSSLNIVTNQLNFGASTSQDQDVARSDVSFGWNILDFGLSYVRARQAGDQYVISKELERRVVHKLLNEVRVAYWRALTGEKLHKRLSQINERAERASRTSRTITQSGKSPKLDALLTERDLIELRQAIVHLEHEILTAKAELAALLNIRPGVPFELVDTPHFELPSELPASFDEMMRTALAHRSEIRENLYQQRINAREAKAAWLELLPGIELTGNLNQDSNSFLLNSNWVDLGASASLNLMRVFQYPANRRLVRAERDVLEMRARALSMTIVTQVYLGGIQYSQQQRSYALAKEHDRVQTQLIKQYRLERKANRLSEQRLLQEELSALIAETRFDLAYSDLQSAYADLFASLGWSPYIDPESDGSIEELATNLKETWAQVDRLTVGKATSAPADVNGKPNVEHASHWPAERKRSSQSTGTCTGRSCGSPCSAGTPEPQKSSLKSLLNRTTGLLSISMGKKATKTLAHPSPCAG